MYSLDQLRSLLGRLRTRPLGSQMQAYPEMPIIRNDMPYGDDMNFINVGPKIPYGARPPRVGPPYPDPLYGEDMQPFRSAFPTGPLVSRPRWNTGTAQSLRPRGNPNTTQSLRPSPVPTTPIVSDPRGNPGTTQPRRYSPDGLTSYTDLPGGITQATSRNPAPELQTRSHRIAPQGTRSHKIPPQVRGLKSYLDRE